jgi:hypothetical protein
LEEALAKGSKAETERASLEAAKRKIDTLPGIVRGMVTDPVTTARLGWQSMGPVGQLSTAALSALPLYSAYKGEDLEPGETKAQRLGQELGAAGGYLIGGPLPIIPSLILASGTGHVGRFLGGLSG